MKKLIGLLAVLVVVFGLAFDPPKAQAFCGGVSHNLGECLDVCGCERDFCINTRPANQGNSECYSDYDSCQSDCYGWYY